MLARMKMAQIVLEFALEGSKNVGASANLAFLERDPTERGPREQFEIDGSTMIRHSIPSALSDGKVCSTMRKAPGLRK